MTHTVQLRFRAARAALAIALVGCDGYSSDYGANPTTNNPALITLEITPLSASILRRGSGQFTVMSREPTIRGR